MENADSLKQSLVNTIIPSLIVGLLPFSNRANVAKSIHAVVKNLVLHLDNLQNELVNDKTSLKNFEWLTSLLKTSSLLSGNLSLTMTTQKPSILDNVFKELDVYAGGRIRDKLEDLLSADFLGGGTKRASEASVL